MAPVETTDAACCFDQRCSFKHWAGWRHNHSNSKLCVAVRMGQAFPYHELSSLRRGHAFFTFKFPATRFVHVILDQGAMRSSQRRRKKEPEFVRVILVQAIFPYRSGKKNYPSQILTVILAQGAMQQYPESPSLYRAVQQCPEEETPSSLRRGHATLSSGSESVKLNPKFVLPDQHWRVPSFRPS